MGRRGEKTRSYPEHPSILCNLAKSYVLIYGTKYYVPARQVETSGAFNIYVKLYLKRQR